MPPLDAINHAAAQSDRWLIIAGVIAGATGTVWTVRYLVTWIRALIDEVRAANLKLVSIIETNSAILARTDEILIQNTRALQELKNKCEGG
jgi:hypothetical protein